MPFFKSAKKKSYLVGAILAGLPPLAMRQERRRRPPSLMAQRTTDSWDFSLPTLRPIPRTSELINPRDVRARNHLSFTPRHHLDVPLQEDWHIESASSEREDKDLFDGLCFVLGNGSPLTKMSPHLERADSEDAEKQNLQDSMFLSSPSGSSEYSGCNPHQVHQPPPHLATSPQDRIFDPVCAARPAMPKLSASSCSQPVPPLTTAPRVWDRVTGRASGSPPTYSKASGFTRFLKRRLSVSQPNLGSA